MITIDDLLQRGEDAVSIHNVDDLLVCMHHAQALLPTLSHHDALLLEAEMHRWRGVRLATLSNSREALEAFERAYELYRERHDHARMARAIGNIGKTYSDLGDHATALEWLHRGLELSDATPTTTRCIILMHIGIVHMELGDLDAAHQWFDSALAECTAINDTVNIARIKGNIGIIYGRRSAYPEALRWLHESLSLHTDAKNMVSAAMMMSAIGNVYKETGDAGTAIEWYTKALEIQEAIGDKRGIAILTGNIGSLYGDVGQYDVARTWIERALAMYEEIDTGTNAAHARGNLGYVCLKQGEYDEAERHIRQALHDARRNGMRALSTRLLGFLLSVMLTCERIDEARELIDEYEEAAHDAPRMIVSAHIMRHLIYRHDGAYEEAEARLKAALVLAEEISIRSQIVEVHSYFRRLYRVWGRFDRYLEHTDLYEELSAQIEDEANRRRIDMRVIEHETSRERQASEKQRALLYNVLPEPIAMRILAGETVADDHADVGVMFVDVVGFTQFSSTTSAAEIVGALNALFSSFDDIARQYGITKIKTIGDAWLGVSNAPTQDARHVLALANAALDMIDRVEPPFECRIGLHVGPLSSGVIGTTRLSWDVWGDTVNVASRMESSGVAGRIHITRAVVKALENSESRSPAIENRESRIPAIENRESRIEEATVKETTFHIEERGEIEVKGKGRMTTYWLERATALPTP